MAGTRPRRCESCRQPLDVERTSAYCVPCAAAFDEHFRRTTNHIADYFAKRCRASGDEAEARRIEKGKR